MFTLTIISLIFAVVYAQNELGELVRTGRYNPQLFGVSGKYQPDHRGKYRHIPVPYDGGYGDRGERYAHFEDLKSRYWQQNGESGTWESPDIYENTAPYASNPYDPSSSVPNYIPGDWKPGKSTYAQRYDYENNGWRVIQFQWNQDGKTRYAYLYETENKILAEEIGKLARLDEDIAAVRVDGHYEYHGDDGTLYGVDYVANEKENGLYPAGKGIHKSIQNVLSFLMKNVTKGLVSL